uniref:Uncharacterized protein n=1 Tax=Oryza barthii TaxID=65489 RepID=A0A0D3GD53_9ORYZ
MSSLPSFAAPHQRAAPTSSIETTEERDVHHKKRSGPKRTKASPNISYIMYFLGPTEIWLPKCQCWLGPLSAKPSFGRNFANSPNKPFLPPAVAALDTPNPEPPPPPPPPPPREVGTSQKRIGDVDLWPLPLLRPLLQLFAVAATGRVRIFFRSVLLAHEVFVEMTGSLVDDDSGLVAVAPWTLVSAPWPGAAGS